MRMKPRIVVVTKRKYPVVPCSESTQNFLCRSLPWPSTASGYSSPHLSLSPWRPRLPAQLRRSPFFRSLQTLIDAISSRHFVGTLHKHKLGGLEFLLFPPSVVLLPRSWDVPVHFGSMFVSSRRVCELFATFTARVRLDAIAVWDNRYQLQTFP